LPPVRIAGARRRSASREEAAFLSGKARRFVYHLTHVMASARPLSFGLPGWEIQPDSERPSARPGKTPERSLYTCSSARLQYPSWMMIPSWSVIKIGLNQECATRRWLRLSLLSPSPAPLTEIRSRCPRPRQVGDKDLSATVRRCQVPV